MLTPSSYVAFKAEPITYFYSSKKNKSFLFFKSNTTATHANCPTFVLSFIDLFLTAVKHKAVKSNG